MCVTKWNSYYHAAAIVHMTIRLIEISAKNNVFSQTGVKNVSLKDKMKQNETFNKLVLDYELVNC